MCGRRDVRPQGCAAAGTAIGTRPRGPGRGDSHESESRGQPRGAALRRPQGRSCGAGASWGPRQWPRRRAPSVVDCGARGRRAPSSYGLRCAAARRSPCCCWSCCCRTPNPRFAPGLARLRVQRATREARPRGRPNRSLSHCRPKRRRDGESGTNRREHCRADSDGGDFGSEMVHSVPPVARPAGRHAMRRPSGVTTPRCRRLVRSARRRRRTR